MDDRFFFNPYMFGIPNTNVPPNLVMPPNLSPQNNNLNDITPKDFYENQYYYYRYLNEFMDYQIKYNDYMKSHSNGKTN